MCTIRYCAARAIAKICTGTSSRPVVYYMGMPPTRKINWSDQYAIIGAVIGIGVGILFGDVAAFAVLGYGLGLLFGYLHRR